MGPPSTYVLVAADVGQVPEGQVNYTDGHGLGQGRNQRFEGAHRRQQLRADVQLDDGHAHVAGEQRGSPQGTNVGNAVEATDSDSGDTLTYYA